MVAVINSSMNKIPEKIKTPLLRKASRTFLNLAVVLMTLSSLALYFYTKALLKNEIEEELYSYKDRLEHLLIENPDLVGVPPMMTVKKVIASESEIIKDTLLFDPLQKEVELFSQLSGTKIINGENYKITVRVMAIESEDILFAIVLTFVSIIILAFIFLFYLNNSRNEALWKPFFINLEKLKVFSLKSGEPLNFVESDIKEFDELNKEMITLTSKVQTDYRNLKQFTEDVSHEMQSPLAIMQAKIENIINFQNIDEFQFEQFSALQIDIQRLKQLNKKLNLLAKIDNDQFTANEVISINDLVRKTIQNFEEIFSIKISLQDNAKINVEMDKTLATVLCNNLISNAIKHNLDDRTIKVKINNNSLQISNQGIEELSKPEHLFERYYKESKKPDSTGLGLSIVKKVCDYYGFLPSYRFIENNHVFYINFGSKI